MSVPGGDGGSSSGSSSILARRVAVWGGLTLGTAYLLRHTLASGAGSRTARPGVLDTDFDSFLVQPDSTPTGVQQASRRRKQKASSSRGGGVPAHARGQVSGPFETFLKVDDAAGSGGSEGDEAEEKEDHRDPVDFASFLKAAIPAGSSSSSGGQKQQADQGQQQGSSKGAAPPAGPTPDQARVLVMYGTEFGFSREIAEKLCDRLRAAKKYWPVLEDMSEHPDGYDFSREQALLIACSTQGDGVPPTESRDFCEWLMAGKSGQLPHMAFSVCALGDTTYTHFCRCGKMLDAALAGAGAACVAPRQDVNREDWAAVYAWMDAAVAGLEAAQLKPVGAEVAAQLGGGGHAAEPKVKRWGKSRPYPARVVAVESLCKVTSAQDKVTVRVELDCGTASGLGNYLPGDALGIYAPNTAEAVDELLLVAGADGSMPIPTPSWHYAEDEEEGGQPVAPPLAAGPGTMTLREALLKCYDLRVPKSDLFHALWAALPDALRKQASEATANGVATSPDDHHHHHASGLANGSAHKGETTQAITLAQLLAGGQEALDKYFDYTGRHVVDVLLTFSAACLDVHQLLAGLRALQPRLYSISSSPLESPGRVQATIAEVRYDALGKTRTGVASTHVSSSIKAGDRVRSYIHKNPDFRLPPDPATPIIMVGPGTGLAPFRSFILQRLLAAGTAPPHPPSAGSSPASSTAGDSSAALSSGSSSSSGGSSREGSSTATPCKAEGGRGGGSSSSGAAGGGGGGGSGQDGVGQMVLFFGCRRRDQDYLYGPVLDSWAAQGAITLHTAFSREQAAKVYVQDRLREAGDEVWRLLDAQGAHFYVCGDASSMAGAVEQELLALFAARLSPPAGKKASKASKKAAAGEKGKEGAVAAAAAKDYLEALAAQGRYQRDVWY